MRKSAALIALLTLVLALQITGAVEEGSVSWKPGDPPRTISSWVYREATAEESGSGIEAGRSDGFKTYLGGYLEKSGDLKDRVYTFRLDLFLDKAAKGVPVSLFMGPGGYPRDVYLNGVLLLRTGSHGDRYNSTVYYSSRVSLPPQLLAYGEEANRLAIEAFPAYETSPLGDFAVGDHYDITKMVFARNLFNVHLVQAAVVVALLIAVFFLFLFAKSPTRDLRYLYFALACVAFALGYSNMSLYNDASDDVFLDKISRSGLALTSLFLCWFSLNFTTIGDRRPRLKLLLAIPVIASIIGNWLQKDKLGVTSFFSSFTTNFVLTPILLFTLGVLIAGFVKKREAARITILAGFLAAVAASLHDIYYISIQVSPFCYMVAYGYLALIIAIFFVLALEQTRVALELEVQSRLLNKRNRVLGDMVEDLTGVAEGLVDSSAEFERTLSATLGRIAGYGEENRAISLSFREEKENAEAEIQKIADRLAESAERVPQALESQTAAVAAVNLTLAQMKERIAENLASAAESSQTAGELASRADESTRVIGLSRNAIAQVAEHSGKLQEVLASIEDISERTHILSINAAIESARLGTEGKGFGVVAQEIRTMSNQSRDSLKSSFEKIKDMTSAVARSSELAESAASSLRVISDHARTSAALAEEIHHLMEGQGVQSANILGNAEALAKEAGVLKLISQEERNDNIERGRQFKSIATSLTAVSSRLDAQDEKTRTLFADLDRLNEVMARNSGHIERLRASISQVSQVQSPESL